MIGPKRIALVELVAESSKSKPDDVTKVVKVSCGEVLGTHTDLSMRILTVRTTQKNNGSHGCGKLQLVMNARGKTRRERQGLPF